MCIMCRVVVVRVYAVPYLQITEDAVERVTIDGPTAGVFRRGARGMPGLVTNQCHLVVVVVVVVDCGVVVVAVVLVQPH